MMVAGMVRMLPSREAQRIETLINQKYGIMKHMIDLMQKLRPHTRTGNRAEDRWR